MLDYVLTHGLTMFAVFVRLCDRDCVLTLLSTVLTSCLIMFGNETRLLVEGLFPTSVGVLRLNLLLYSTMHAIVENEQYKMATLFFSVIQIYFFSKIWNYLAARDNYFSFSFTSLLKFI